MLDLQRFAVDAQAGGALVCLASKNTEQDVLDVFEKRPEMVLKTEHIVAHRINWQPKSDNIASLAGQLNLGLDSFVFIDDNPVECAQVRAALPQVVTLQPPESAIAQFLSRTWAFDKISVTAEDTRRTEMYRENTARQSLEASTTDIGDFIASLGLVVDIASPSEDEWPRVAQLTQRTNQFNFTTLRRTESEIRSAASEAGSSVLRVRVRETALGSTVSSAWLWRRRRAAGCWSIHCSSVAACLAEVSSTQCCVDSGKSLRLKIFHA